MKNTFILLIAIAMTSACDTKVVIDTSDQESASNEDVFDANLAKELNADQYGMRMYVMAFLKEGPNRDLDSAASADLQRQHLDNIKRLAEEGKLSLAGPFAADGDPVRGIYIFNVTSLDEARELTATDPAIQSDSLEMELRQWYGSAALQLTNQNHKKISRENI